MINFKKEKIDERKIIKIIKKYINKKIFKYYFIETDLQKLPDISYPEKGDLEYQKKLIDKFDQTQSQTSSMTCPHLMELLLMKFDSKQNFSFLDVGGEKIDFYLELKKNFKNIEYFLFNQKSMLDPFHKIRDEFNFKDLHLIDNLDDISDNYDFINFGSCIQYFNNYEVFLEKVTRSSKFIFFSGTHLYDKIGNNQNKNVVVKQLNVASQTNYLFFFCRKDFFKIFEEKEYNFIFESKNLTDKINYNNLKYKFMNIQYSDFLFSKKI